MSRITVPMIKLAYETGKKVSKNKMSYKEGIGVLEEFGMNRNSASDYIYNYSCLVQGKLFTRTTNSTATDYFLKRIYEDQGIEGLKNALLSLSQHIDYYEDVSGSNVKKRKEIYESYLKLSNLEIDSVYPDEIEEELKFPEGKTKQVLVNSYERNPIARKKCLEHYGFICQVCNFKFKEKYGELGNDFIHIHHKIDISTIGKEYSVDPINDLIPVCPNCHAMLHKQKPALTIEDLKGIIKKMKDLSLGLKIIK